MRHSGSKASLDAGPAAAGVPSDAEHPFFQAKADGFERLVTPAAAARDFPRAAAGSKTLPPGVSQRSTADAPLDQKRPAAHVDRARDVAEEPGVAPKPRADTRPQQRAPEASSALLLRTVDDAPGRVAENDTAATSAMQSSDVHRSAAPGEEAARRREVAFHTLQSDARVAVAPTATPRAGVASSSSAAAAPVAGATGVSATRAVDESRIVDPELVLGVEVLLRQVLSGLLKRLPRTSTVPDLRSPFADALETPAATTIVAAMHTVLTGVNRYLHGDSQLTRRGAATALQQVALKLKLESVNEAKAERRFTNAPQAAAFFGRQEDKIRKALSKLDAVRREINSERDAAFRDFFLPVADEPAPHSTPGLLPRRRGPTIPPVATDSDGSQLRPDASKPVPDASTLHVGADVSSKPAAGHGASVSFRGIGHVHHAPDHRYAATIRAAGDGARTPPGDSERAEEGEGRRRGDVPLSVTPQPGTAALEASPDFNPRWRVRPAGLRRATTLGELRAPARARRRPMPLQRFEPDSSLFSSPLMGQSASMTDRRPSPPRD